MHKLFIIILLSLCFFTCKKTELPAPTEEKPVFSLEGILDGFSFNIIAGEDNYALFTIFEKDASDVFSFIGRFAQIDCGIQCRDTFTIKIRDFTTSPNGLVNLDEALKVGNYSYAGSNVTMQIDTTTIIEYFANFDASNSIGFNFFTNYAWNINNQIIPAGPINNLSLVFGDTIPNEISANLTLSDNQGCDANQTKIISLTPNMAEEKCSVTISTNPMGGSFLFATSNGTNPVQYAWSTGDFTQDITVPQDTVVGAQYSVTVTDAAGCIASSTVSFIGQSGASGNYCIADFSTNITVNETLDIDTTIIIDSLQLSTVIIEYTDEDGHFYSTELGEQIETTNSFSIISVEDFDRNEQGNPTKKLEIEFDCILYDEMGNGLDISNGLGVIGVAYPE